MGENTTDSVQNRFTAYLVATVTNKRIKYIEHKKRFQETKYINADLLEKSYTGFEVPLHK